MSETNRQRMLDLAERLARRERFDPAWIAYPTWAGIPPDSLEKLETAAKYRKWAAAILAGEISPPPWLAEEDPDLVPAATTPSPPPTKHRRPRPGGGGRFACRLAEETETFVFPKPLKKGALPPATKAVAELAVRLGRRRFPEAWYSYPQWASWPRTMDLALAAIAKLKRQAEKILAGAEPPPPWLLRTDPARWRPPPLVKPIPAPATVLTADRHLRLRACPLAAAWLLLAASAPAPPPVRPPPLPLWRSPRRYAGNVCPGAPPARERRCVSRDSNLWQPESSLYLAACVGGGDAA